MAFTGNYMCTSFKKELLEAVHNFTVAGNTFKLALYDNNATFNASTTDYTPTNESSGAGYSAGGGTLTNIAPTTGGTTSFTSFSDLTFSNSTITARGALLYNSTAGTNTVLVLDFGSNKSSTNGDFTIVFPTADQNNAIIRIA
jgi:hypothetical protein